MVIFHSYVSLPEGNVWSTCFNSCPISNESEWFEMIWIQQPSDFVKVESRPELDQQAGPCGDASMLLGACRGSPATKALDLSSGRFSESSPERFRHLKVPKFWGWPSYGMSMAIFMGTHHMKMAMNHDTSLDVGCLTCFFALTLVVSDILLIFFIIFLLIFAFFPSPSWVNLPRFCCCQERLWQRRIWRMWGKGRSESSSNGKFLDNPGISQVPSGNLT